jgi:hypothetical protein
MLLFLGEYPTLVVGDVTSISVVLDAGCRYERDRLQYHVDT